MNSFKAYQPHEFNDYIKQVLVSRKILHIQIHHTWKPTKAAYKGESTIAGMWKYHTKEKGWSDIAQHFSIAPDGLIWSGRSIDKDPAGIVGHNKGGLMFEIIGNFDTENLEGHQLQSVIIAVNSCLMHFKLSYEDIVFHRDFAKKSCPGLKITKEWFNEQLKSQSAAVDVWKTKAVDWLYENKLLTNEEWRHDIEKPLPLWAEAILLKRILEKNTL